MRWVLKFASYKSPDDIFNAVESGTKTIETRPRNPKSKRDYSNIKAGDILILKSLDSGRSMEKIVNFVHLYASVQEMTDNEPVGKIFPGVKTAEELVGIFEEFKKKWGKSYSQKLDENGIVAIGMW